MNEIRMWVNGIQVADNLPRESMQNPNGGTNTRLGSQIVGGEGVKERINLIALALLLKAGM